MNFPEIVSFTVTNTCNLRCRMCGQWSAEGYIKNNAIDRRSHMKLEDWKCLVDEITHYKIRFILLRGGEPHIGGAGGRRTRLGGDSRYGGRVGLRPHEQAPASAYRS